MPPARPYRDPDLFDLQSGEVQRQAEALARLQQNLPDRRRAEIVPAIENLVTERELASHALPAYILWAGKDGVPVYYKLLKPETPHNELLFEPLVRYEGGRAAEAIAGMIRHTEVAHRALERIGPDAEPAVLKYAKHEDPTVRLFVCRILKVIATAKGVAALKELREDKNRTVADAARSALAVVDGWNEARDPDLFDLGANDRARRIGAAARLSVAVPDRRRKAVAQALLGLLGDSDQELRIYAQRGYIVWAGADGVPTYYKLLKPGCLEPHLLMDALAKHEGAKAADAVGVWLKDFFHHEFAKRALQAMGPGAEPTVLKYLKADGDARMQACRVLQVIGTPKCFPELAAAATNKDDPEYASAAQKALDVLRYQGEPKK